MPYIEPAVPLGQRVIASIIDFGMDYSVLLVILVYLAVMAYQFYDNFYRVKMTTDSQDDAMIQNFLYIQRRRVLASRNETVRRDHDRV